MPTLGVQMGHVARSTGATGTTGEQVFARATAAAIQRLFRGTGWAVRVLHADVPNSAYNDLDVFAAVHCDGSIHDEARGASVGYITTPGGDLGDDFLNAYAKRGWTGGFRNDNYTPALKGYYGTRKAVAAGCRRAIILEAGFMTNPGNRELLAGTAGPLRVALALADALNIDLEDDMPLNADDKRYLEGLLGNSQDAHHAATRKAVNEVPLDLLGYRHPRDTDGPDVYALLRQSWSQSAKVQGEVAGMREALTQMATAYAALSKAPKAALDVEQFAAAVEAATERGTAAALAGATFSIDATDTTP